MRVPAGTERALGLLLEMSRACNAAAALGITRAQLDTLANALATDPRICPDHATPGHRCHVPLFAEQAEALLKMFSSVERMVAIERAKREPWRHS